MERVFLLKVMDACWCACERGTYTLRQTQGGGGESVGLEDCNDSSEGCTCCLTWKTAVPEGAFLHLTHP